MTNLAKLMIGFLSIAFIGVGCFKKPTVNPQALRQENACVQSLQLGDYQGAETRCKLCLEYNAKVPECVNGLGLVAFARNQDSKAEKYFTQAIQMGPTFAQARNNLGAISFRKQQYNEAIPLFRAAVQLDPGYQDARYNFGLSYLRLGQKAMISKDNSKAEGDFKKALEKYRYLLAVAPTYVNAYRDMGLIMTYLASLQTDDAKLQKDLNQAKTYFSQCLQIAPSSEGCLESYGHTLLYQNDFEKALYEFVQCLAVNKDNPVCIQGMDAAYQASQIKSAALNVYINLLKKNPDDARGHYGYCDALFKKKLDKMAVSECKKSLALNPKECDAYFQLSMYYKRTLNSAEALGNCKSYLLCDLSGENSSQVSQCHNVVTALSGE